MGGGCDAFRTKECRRRARSRTREDHATAAGCYRETQATNSGMACPYYYGIEIIWFGRETIWRNTLQT
jgi:hypothetical protein